MFESEFGFAFDYCKIGMASTKSRYIHRQQVEVCDANVRVCAYSFRQALFR